MESKNKNKELVQNALKMLEIKHANISDLIHNYFSKEYIQTVDGKKLDIEEFCKHIQFLEEATKSVTIEFQQILEENNIVFSRHKVTSVMKNGDKAIFLVFAEFGIKNNKIYYCNELTSLQHGVDKYSNLGSNA